MDAVFHQTNSRRKDTRAMSQAPMPRGADDKRTDQDLVESLVQGILTHSSSSLLLEYRRLSSYETGKIGVEELFDMLKDAGLDVSQDRTDTLMLRCDRDGDDLMTKSDFVYLVSNNSTPTISPTIRTTTQHHQTDDINFAPEESADSFRNDNQVESNHNVTIEVEPDENQIVADDTNHVIIDDDPVVVDDSDDEMALTSQDISAIVYFQEAMRSTGGSTRNFFKKIDSDHTQYITTSQLMDGFNSLKVNVTMDQIDRIMYRFEAEDKPGELKYFQMVKLLSIEL